MDEPGEPLDQLLLRVEAGTGKAPPPDDSEDDFDLVQPRAVFGSKHKANSMGRVAEKLLA